MFSLFQKYICYLLNFKNLKDLNSSPFITFGYILNDSEVLFSFYKISSNQREKGVISWGNQFYRTTELFGPPSVFQLLKFKGPNFSVICQISIYFLRNRHSLHFDIFYMIQEYFSHFSKKFPQTKEGGLISWGNQYCRATELYGPPFQISIFKI